jgi:hypothetical protein
MKDQGVGGAVLALACFSVEIGLCLGAALSLWRRAEAESKPTNLSEAGRRFVVRDDGMGIDFCGPQVDGDRQIERRVEDEATERGLGEGMCGASVTRMGQLINKTRTRMAR